MPLWGNTDAVADQPNWINLAQYPAGTQLIFVDTTEALEEANKARGLTNAGWWLYREYTDAAGDTRYKAECVVAMARTSVEAGDQADDRYAADATNVITISAQPADQTSAAGAATFSVTASVTNSGVVTYQWQKKAAGATRWANVSGETSASIVLAGQTVAEDGDMYRVKLNSDNGAKEVTSDAATLTFGS